MTFLNCLFRRKQEESPSAYSFLCENGDHRVLQMNRPATCKVALYDQEKEVVSKEEEWAKGFICDKCVEVIASGECLMVSKSPEQPPA